MNEADPHVQAAQPGIVRQEVGRRLVEVPVDQVTPTTVHAVHSSLRSPVVYPREAGAYA
ncbi:hypothetical protein [Microbispora bryophytorum]|uniref:hypothetical protein n=1 Tax=Microbispora bryophytorum TaxID=1460882 RepID=UPI0033C7DA87